MTESTCTLIMELSSVIRTILLTLFFMGLWKHLMEPAPGKRKYLFALVFCYLLIINMFDLPAYIRYIPIFGLCILYVHYFKICKWEKPVFLLLFLYHLHTVSFLIANSFYQIAVEVLTSRLDMEAADVIDRIYWQTAIMQIILMIVYGLVFLSLYLLFVRWKPELSDMTVMEFVFLSVQNAAGIILAFLVVRLSVIPLQDEVFVLYEQAADMLWKVPAIALLLLIGEFASIYLFCQYKRYLLERESVISRQLGLRQLESRMEEAQVLYGNLRSLRHDIKNHMQAIQGLIETGQAQETKDYIDRLNQAVEEIDGKFVTGNTLCDVVLNDKYRIALKERIKMTAEFRYDGGIADYDMGIILSNLCDNAIEACRKLAEDERFVDITLTSSGPCILLIVSNSFDGRTLYYDEQGFPITTKKEDTGQGNMHGVGLRNIAAIAEDYFGMLRTEAEGKVFSATVMLQKKHPVVSEKCPMV